MNINSISAPSGTAINQNPFIVTKTFQSLSKHLQTYDFEKYLDEVTYHILHSNTSMIKDGSVEQFGDWIYTLKFIGNDEKRRKVVNRLREEEIDGFTFMYLTDIEWLNDLKLDRYIFELLSCIRSGWAGVWTDPVDVPEGVPCGVVTGVVADLRAVSVDMARELVAANNDCKSTGAGLFYGQLVVLGYREYRMEGDIFQPVGQSNDKFVLRRRTIPNGLTFVSGARTATATHRIKYTSRVATKDMMLTEEGSGVDTRTVSSQGEFCFAPDPATDVFQVGRLIEPNNDFVVKGPLHYDSSGKQCGPVSRLACRIVCSRLPPFRCFILASGFNADKCEIVLGESMIQWDEQTNARAENDLTRWNSFDALTTFGIKLWTPEIQAWREVSIKGRAYAPRRVNGTVGEKLHTDPTTTQLGLEITDGSLIDLCGAVLLFQKPTTMANQKQVNPQTIISSLNKMRPHCPVSLNSIRFSYRTPRQREQKAISKLEATGVGFVPCGGIHIPTTDYSDVDEEQRTYVFPACGHVHGYNISLENSRCSLCRKVGPFVPIAFSFESSICGKKPTHVFNPCGCAASEQTCKRWSQIPIFDYTPAQQNHCRPQCPFCATPLEEDASKGGPFNRLILQTEGGAIMQSDDELIESSSVSVSGMHETLSLSMQDQPLHHPGIPTDASDQDCATRMPNKFTVMPSSPMLQGPLRDPEKDSLLTVVKDKTPNYLSQPALALGPELQLLRRERQFVFSDAHTDSQSNIRNDDLSSLLALIPSFPTYAPQLALLDEEYTARNLNMDWTEE